MSHVLDIAMLFFVLSPFPTLLSTLSTCKDSSNFVPRAICLLPEDAWKRCFFFEEAILGFWWFYYKLSEFELKYTNGKLLIFVLL